jgi:hypothetical protein
MADENDKPHTAFAEAMEKAQEHQSEGGEISRRKPGRPPKSTAGINNTVDTYRPSVERNNIDQALQPTGEGDTAGLGGSSIHAGANEAEKVHEAQEADLFPVLIRRGYVPLTDNWCIVKEDGSFGPKPHFEEDENRKVRPGFKIALPKEEARGLIKAGIAERADEL